MQLSLKDKNALVCGSTQGIGLAAALELAKLGANVTLLARNEARLQAALEKLDNSQGQNHNYMIADFSKPDQLQTTLNSKGRIIHILVNNTGGPAAGQAHTADIDEFRAAFEMHLVCNQILAREVVDGMKEAGYGRIINVISTSVKQPLDNLGVSNTIRGAVANWAKTMANELGQFGITVNNVLPGATNTARLKSIIENKANKSGKTQEEVAKSMQGIIPARRFAEAEEVGSAIAFLASPAASYINGVNLPVDGGRTKCL